MYLTSRHDDKSAPLHAGLGHEARPDPLLTDLLPLEEATLLASARSGDNAAAGQIFDRHGQAVLELACAILRDREQAEAVIVDVFAQACTGTGDTYNAASLRHRLARLTYLRCVQQLPAVAETSCASTQHDDRAVAAMTRLRELARQQRTAIALVAVGDHSYLEVAQLLRLTPTRVLALLHSCLRELEATDQGSRRDRAPLVRRRHSSWALSEFR